MELGFKRKPNSYFTQLTLLKKLFWLYFLLLIFEGALRKWVAPGLSAPLLVIRDPVSLLIIWEAYRTRKWPTRWSVPIVVLTFIVAGIFSLQLAMGDNQLLVGLYGLRSYLLPFPVIFIMGENLSEEDMRRLGACTLWLLLPITAIAVAQYVMPATSFVNRGAYVGGAQIGYVGGHVRASGTFSFVTELTQFGTLAAAFIFFGMVKEDFVNRWVLWASSCALLICIPTTGARTLVTQIALVLACVALSAMMGVSQFVKVLRVIIPILIVPLLVSYLPVFKDAMQSMTDRFEGAAISEGGSQQSAYFDRTILPALRAFEAASDTPSLMGIGVGRGAVAVQTFLTGSTQGVTGEYEFSHELMEMGPIAGSAFALFKLLLAIALFARALARAREHEPLALLLFPLVVGTLFYGLLEQPGLQGFVVISLAFCIAAGKRPLLAARPLAGPMLRQQQALQQLLERRQAFRQQRLHGH
jgi:hypothetical protein